MFKSFATLFSSNTNTLKTLYLELSNLNRQVIRGDLVLSMNDLKNPDNHAQAFLFQYFDKNGEIYDQVIAMANQKDPYAIRICSLATNIRDIMSVQVKLNQPNASHG